MTDLARYLPHDQLVERAFAAGATGQRMPNFGYLTGFAGLQVAAINDAYEAARRQFLARQQRTKP